MEIQIKNTFGTYTVTDGKEKRREWKKTFRILKNHLYLTISNCRVKKRSDCGYNRQGKLADNMRDIKGRMYEKQQGRCPHCGGGYDLSMMELHHVLPWARFPELRASSRNMLLLCHNCHKEIHCNPFLNIRLMEQKAAELGINLKERYDYGNSQTTLSGIRS